MNYAVFLRRQPDGGQVKDGTWHRVGFTWDNSSRKPSVDDVLVAKDTRDELAHCYGGLNIGTSHNMAPDS